MANSGQVSAWPSAQIVALDTVERGKILYNLLKQMWKFLLHFREMLSLKINTGNYKHEQNKQAYLSGGF